MRKVFVCLLLLPLAGLTAQAQDDGPSKKEMIKEALSAAIPSVAKDATVVDWEGNTLREGTSGWTCLPSPPNAKGPMPMCLDSQWLSWAQAWQGHTQPDITGIGFGYMVVGAPADSNTDPYAEGKTADNEWMESQPPHIMMLVPDASALEGLPTAFDNGGPWVMWAGTPYVHVMIPTE